MPTLLIDLSSIIYPIWHMSASEPDPNHTSSAAVARVHALASGHEHVAVCCDDGRSFRHEVSADYKANRPEREESLTHQLRIARETLIADGFPVWGVRGFEADDVIATAATKVDGPVLIATADKDLLQLVDDRVQVKSVRDGSILDTDAVAAKFGVLPAQMRDYLTLVGDASDNVKGAKGIGPKRAAELLAAFGTLDNLYANVFGDTDAVPPATPYKLTPAIEQSLRDFHQQMYQTRTLITLRTDVEIPGFDALYAERVAVPQESVPMADYDSTPEPEPPQSMAAVLPAQAVVEMTTAQPTQALAPIAVEWERSLDPRSLREAQALAMDMHQSRMFSSYGSPQAVLSTILTGRELGLPAMTSLRTIHNIEGKHALSAQLIVALVLRSGLCDYFAPVEVSDTAVTFETQRKGGKPIRLTHTIQMAQVAGLVKPKSGWEKNPTDMLVARCSARLARLVFPDIAANVYTPDELEDARHAA